MSNTNNVEQKDLPSIKEVKVVSKVNFNERVVVVIKKVIPKQGPIREVFNSYLFDNNGECIMPEKDAILHWKVLKSIPERRQSVKIFSLKNDIEYEYSKVKDLYEVEETDLSGSQSRD